MSALRHSPVTSAMILVHRSVVYLADHSPAAVKLFSSIYVDYMPL